MWRALRGVLLETIFQSTNFLALIASTALSLLFGHAAVQHLRTGIVGGRSDGYENAWNDYWLRTALFHLHTNPFFTTYVEYPTGASLRFHALNPLGGLLALPLVPLIGPLATVNCKLLLSLACSTFFAFLLMRQVTGNALAAFAGAAVYTYANDQVVLDYLEGTVNYLMGTALLPLVLLFILRAATREHWLRDAIGATLVLLALCLTDWQYALFAVIAATLYVVFTALTNRDKAEIHALLGRFALISGVLAGIIFVPLVLPMLREAQANPWLAVSESSVAHSRSVAESFQPGEGNPGYLVLALTVIGLILLWRRSVVNDRKAVAFWGVVAALGLVLSFGPQLKLTPDRVTRIPLPYALWNHLPIASIGRKPFLFYASLGMLAIGVLLAFALRALFPLLSDALRHRTWMRWMERIPAYAAPSALVAILLIVTLAPSLAFTRQGEVIPPQWPPFYRDVLAHDPDSYAILEMPLFAGYSRGRSEGVYNAYQLLHGKYRFSSSLSRDHKADNPNLIVKQGTLFRDFFWFDKPPMQEIYRPTKTADFLPTPEYPAVSIPLLNFYHVRYLVLYLDALRDTGPAATATARNLVHQAIGADVRPVYADDLMEAYRVPDVPPLANPLFVDTGSIGWWQAEKGPDTVPYRWADTRDGKAAQLIAFNLTQEPQTARIEFSLFNYKGNRTVEIAMNNRRVDGLTLTDGATRDISLDLALAPGLNVLTFSTPEPSLPIETVAKRQTDGRLLSFGLKQVRIRPRS
ncbi:MAG: hypothetical protein ACR2M3_17395 [Thermomicrobiales bacterium]